MNKRTIQISAGLILVLSVIIYILFLGDDFVRETGRFPFICNPEANHTISRFASSYPPNRILVVSGSYKSGKSRALEELAKKYSEQSQLPVEIRIDRADTFENLVDLLKSSLVRNFMQLSKSLPMSKMEEFSQMNWKSRNFNQKHGELGNGFSGAQLAIENSLDLLLHEQTFVEGLNEFVDVLQRINTILPVNVFIHFADNIQNLKSEKGQEFGKIAYEYCLKYFENHYWQHSTIRVGLEIRDSRLIEKLKPINGISVAILSEIVDLPNVMHKFGIFRREEGKPIYKIVGGQTAALYSAFMEMNYGNSPPVIAKQFYDADYEAVLKLLTNTTDTLWYDLCEEPLPDASNLTLFAELLKLGYLYTDGNHTVYTGSRAVQQAICSIRPKKYRKVKPTSTPTPKPTKAPKKTPKPTATPAPAKETPSPSPVVETPKQETQKPKKEEEKPKKGGWFSKSKKEEPKPTQTPEAKKEEPKPTPEAKKEETKKVEEKKNEEVKNEAPKKGWFSKSKKEEPKKEEEQKKVEPTPAPTPEAKKEEEKKQETKKEETKNTDVKKEEPKKGGWFSKSKKEEPKKVEEQKKVEQTPEPKPTEAPKATATPKPTEAPKKGGWFSKSKKEEPNKRRPTKRKLNQ